MTDFVPFHFAGKEPHPFDNVDKSAEEREEALPVDDDLNQDVDQILAEIALEDVIRRFDNSDFASVS